MKQLTIVEKFRKWLEVKHLNNCWECRDKGEIRLGDYEAYAYHLFKEFYEEKMEKT